MFAGTSPLWSLGPFFKEGKMVKIPSYNSGPFPNEFMSLKDGSYKNSPVKIDGLMVYPKKGEGPFPVLVFNHASGGSWMWSNEWFKFDRLMASQLLKKGIAVLFVDNFTGRHVIDASTDQSQVSTYSFYIDAFMTLEFLSKEEIKIDFLSFGSMDKFPQHDSSDEQLINSNISEENIEKLVKEYMKNNNLLSISDTSNIKNN